MLIIFILVFVLHAPALLATSHADITRTPAHARTRAPQTQRQTDTHEHELLFFYARQTDSTHRTASWPQQTRG
jgi:hypothetical protein